MFDVLVDAGPPPSGRVTILEADVPVGVRHVEADTCADVADALALVIALSVDPRASAPVTSARNLPPAPPEAVAPKSSSEPAIDRATPENDRSNPRGGLFVGADFAVSYGVAPSAMLAVAPYVGWRSNAEGVLAPAIRLALVHATDDGQQVPLGSADFAWTAGRLDLCPTDWTWSSLSFMSCVRIEGGVLTVASHDVALPERRVRPWFAAGALARAEWFLLRPVFLDADIDVLLRATDDRFYFLPETTVYQVPIVGVSGSLGLGAHFL